MDVAAIFKEQLPRGIPTSPLPPPAKLDRSVPHAPVRTTRLSPEEEKLAVSNALRYFPPECHAELAKEFYQELKEDGHIYMRRFRPTDYEIKAYPIEYYPAKTKQAAAIMLMIHNNLDKEVAQFPHELVTYGGNGSVLSNWAQYHLVMKYLCEMTEDQTLTMYSGHPMGLFPSHPSAPRVVITNGMVIPNYSSKEDYDKYYALGVSMYGQMTAGSYCYIGPQGIVHGTTLTLLNAGRLYLSCENMLGKVFVTAGLGGMSGAQAKAAVVCGAIGVIAEVSESALAKRHDQGWVLERVDSLDCLVSRIKELRKAPVATSIAYLGNVVDVWERLAKEEELLVDLGSDQTSLHNPYNGGYYPASLSFDEANKMMAANPDEFKVHVQKSLVRHVNAVNALCKRGMHFWDYGNSFLIESKRAGADIMDERGINFKYPSYVQHIMGDIFSLGFGPFRWVCTSGKPEDLRTTDRIAAEAIEKLMEGAPPKTKAQYKDNLLWIREAEKHRLVVGSQARILYSDSEGRIALAKAFNQAIAKGEISAPVVLSRDHHDVSGTDSPWRETSNIYDGSMFCADMAVQNFVGDGFRGATWISLHNGGGTGWGEATNGGFGFVLDGSKEAEERAEKMLFWDVNNGVSRRAWCRNENAVQAITREMEREPLLRVTVPAPVDDDVVAKACT